MFGQTEIWVFSVFALFHLRLRSKVHQSPWKVFTHRGGTSGTIYHALGMVLDYTFRGFLCIFLRLHKPCFQVSINKKNKDFQPGTRQKIKDIWCCLEYHDCYKNERSSNFKSLRKHGFIATTNGAFIFVTFLWDELKKLFLKKAIDTMHRIVDRK